MLSGIHRYVVVTFLVASLVILIFESVCSSCTRLNSYVLCLTEQEIVKCSFLVVDTVTILATFVLILVGQYAQLLVSIELSACLLPVLELVFLVSTSRMAKGIIYTWD